MPVGIIPVSSEFAKSETERLVKSNLLISSFDVEEPLIVPLNSNPFIKLPDISVAN